MRFKFPVDEDTVDDAEAGAKNGAVSSEASPAMALFRFIRMFIQVWEAQRTRRVNIKPVTDEDANMRETPSKTSLQE